MSGTNYIASNWRTPENSNSSKNDNYSLSFDGATSYIDCGNIPALNGVTAASWSIWAKKTDTSDDYLMSCYSATGSLQQYLFHWYIDKLYIYLANSAGTLRLMSRIDYTFNVDEWYHIGIVYNESEISGSDKVKVYINGGLGVNRTTGFGLTSLRSTTASTNIGRAGGFTTKEFGGEISEASIFDYALDETQISTLYGDATSGAGNPMALKPTPVGYWPLGDNSASDPLAQPNVAVEDASVFDFDGSNDYIVLSNTIDLGINSSISVWVNLDSNYSGVLLGSESYDSYYFIQARYNDFFVRIASVFNSFPLTDNALTAGSWHNLVVTRSGDSISTYVDGNFIETKTGYGTSVTTKFDTIANRQTSSLPLEGKINELSAFNTTLTPEDVTTIYNSGVPGDLSSLNPLAWYKLDQSANWEADTIGAWQIPDAVSEFPQSFDFDGTNYINCGEISPLFEHFPVGTATTSPWSASMWVKGSSLGAFFGFPWLTVNSSYSYAFGFGWSPSLGLYFGGKFAGIKIKESGTTAFSTTSWNNIVMTFDGVDYTALSSYTLYVGGVPIPIALITPNIDEWRSKGVTIGASGDPATGVVSYWDGKISNVQLWDATLTPEKVTTLYNGGTPTLTPPNQSDLKAWYKLDGSDKSIWNSSSAADTWLIEDATITPTYTEGLFFGGAYIGGSPVQNYAGLKLTNQTISASHISYSAWVKIIQPEVGSTSDIFNPINTNYLGTFTYRAAGSAMMWRGDNASKFIATPSTINSGAWHHIFCSYPNGSTIDHTQVKIYIDGSLQTNNYVGGTTSTGPVTNMLGILLGSVPKNMVISNWAFWLNDQSSNIATIYNNGTPSDLSTLNPEVWYKFNSANTTFNGVTGGEYGVATDSSGNNNNGDIAGKTDGTTTRLETSNVQAKTGASTGMTEQSLVNNNVSTLNGESSGMTSGNLVLSDLSRNLPYENYSLQFDGTADYIDCGNVTGLNNAPNASWSFWMNPSATGFRYMFSAYGTTGSNQQIYFGKKGTGVSIRLRGQGYVGGTPIMFDESSQTWTLGQWYHVVVTFDGAESDNAQKVKVYVNGNPLTNTSVGAAITNINTTTENFYIALLGGYTTNEFGGNISNMAIWNNTLSSTEIQNLYANGMPQDLTTFTPQPINWWTLGKESFWNGSNFITRDMISSNDGTSANMGVDSLAGDAPRSQANGVGTDIAVPTDLKGNAGWSDKNGYSINMSSTARTTDTP
jgi:hypothetical protein